MAETVKTQDDALTKLVGYFEDSEEQGLPSRQLSERDRDYFDDKQLSPEVIAELNKRKQPIIVKNKIKPKINFLVGMEIQTRRDPKAYPRNPSPEDELSSEAATDSLRYVTENNQFDKIKTKYFKTLALEGTTGVDVVVKPNTRGGVDIKILRYMWDRIFWDPHSREEDFLDSKYHGGVMWMDSDDAETTFGKGKSAVVDTTLGMQDSSASDTFEDKPDWFADKNRRRVRVIFIHYNERGVWKYAVFAKGGFFIEPEVSQYLDEDGEPEPSMLLQSAFVDREGGRYGAARQFIGSQDEINKRSSKSLHLLSVRQTFGNKGAVEDVQKAKTELAKPDGHLEIKGHAEFGKDFGVLPTNDMAIGQFQMLQEAKADIDSDGPNEALQGAGPAESGRARQTRQQGGIVELGPLFEASRDLEIRIYRRVWNCVRQFWTAEKWIRITDDQKKPEFIGLNRPVTMGEKLEKELPNLPPEQQAEAAQLLQQFADDPRMQEVVAVENDLAELDIDIMIEDAPDIVNLQSEQFELLVDMFRVAPDAIPIDMIIETSSLRNKDRILERLQGDPEAQEAQRQQLLEAKQAEQAAEIENTQADTVGKQAKAAKDFADAQETSSTTIQ